MKQAAFAFTLSLAARAGAAEDNADSGSVADLSLEELVNIRVTSVSNKAETLNDAAAAVFVLTNDDLRQSGATNLPDALRLAPGLDVGALGSSSWAVSSRGFNSEFANKLLVMIDGRTVYSPEFSGVYWDVQQPFLDDVDRIEVIRGPGATVWGANAVNGVISIVSKSARDTQGALVYGGGGDPHLAMGGFRYGGVLGDDTYYRIYASEQLNESFHQSNGRSAKDGWEMADGGFRIDRYTKSDGQLTWQGDVSGGNLANQMGDVNGGNMLGRWTQTISDRSNYEIQAFLDHEYRSDYLSAAYVNTADLTFQHTFGLGARNDIIWGLGYRFTDTRIDHSNSPAIAILDPTARLNLFSAFIQDAFKVIPDRLTFTLGTKIEHNDFTGFELEPSARLSFKPTKNQTLWAAVSRAVRSPSEEEAENLVAVDLGAPVVGPGGRLYEPTVVGNTGIKSEVLLAYELGYRIQPTPKLNIDAAAFYNDYSRLVSQSPTGYLARSPVGEMTLEFENALRGESYGGETVATYAATRSWRLSASYSLLMVHVQGGPASVTGPIQFSAPQNQLVVRSSYDITAQLSLDGQLRYVDDVRNIHSYFTGDVRLSYRVTSNLDLSIVGQNLFQSRHPEQANPLGGPTFDVPRGIYGKITWRF